jgi:hypothetical protein
MGRGTDSGWGGWGSGWGGWGSGWGGNGGEDDVQDSSASQSQESPPWGGQGGNYDAQFASLRADIRDDLRKTIKREVAKSCSGSSDGDDEECTSEEFSPAADQGAQFLKEVYGKNPNAYIRKDSIPCYNCTVPQ